MLASGEISFPDVGTANEDGIGVPLKADGKTIGVVMVQSYTKGVEYTDQDEQVLEFVAQHIAVALTRARATEETRQRNYELQIINSVQEGLASQLDIQAIFDLVGDMICEIFKSDSAGIFTYDRETNLEYFPYLMQIGRRLSQEPLPLDEKGFSPARPGAGGEGQGVRP